MRFVNLTPHTINNALNGEAIHPSGVVARCATTEKEVLPGFFSQEFGQVSDLPKPQQGVLLIVSALVRNAVPDRGDVVSPGALVRDESGQPVGCKGFAVNPGFAEFFQAQNPPALYPDGSGWLVDESGQPWCWQG